MLTNLQYRLLVNLKFIKPNKLIINKRGILLGLGSYINLYFKDK